MKRVVVLMGFAAILTAAVASAMIPLPETEYGIVTRLGKPVRILDEAGLAWKLPWPFEAVTRIDRRFQVFDPVRATATDDEHLTADRMNLLVTCFCVWRVADPLKFLVSVR